MTPELLRKRTQQLAEGRPHAVPLKKLGSDHPPKGFMVSLTTINHRYSYWSVAYKPAILNTGFNSFLQLLYNHYSPLINFHITIIYPSLTLHASKFTRLDDPERSGQAEVSLPSMHEPRKAAEAPHVSC